MSTSNNVERDAQTVLRMYEEIDYFNSIFEQDVSANRGYKDLHGYFPKNMIKLVKTNVFVGNTVSLDGAVVPEMIGPSVCVVEYKKEFGGTYSELIKIEPWKFVLDMVEGATEDIPPQVVFKACARLNGSLDRTLYDGYYRVTLYLDDLERVPYDEEDLSYDISDSARANMTVGLVLKYHHSSKPVSQPSASARPRPSLPALTIPNSNSSGGLSNLSLFLKEPKEPSPSHKNHRPSLPEKVILPLPKPAVPALNLSPTGATAAVAASSGTSTVGGRGPNGVRSSAAAALFLQQEAESLGPLFAKTVSSDSSEGEDEEGLIRTKSDDSIERNIQNEIAALEAYIPKILRNQILGQITWNCIDTLLSENSMRFESSNKASIERLHGVMLFVDISGFTSLSLCMNVETFKNSINEYFTTMLKIVQEEEGEVIKFAGDALFILWQTEAVDSEESFRAASLSAADRAITCGLRINEVCNHYPMYYDEVTEVNSGGFNGPSTPMAAEFGARGALGAGDVNFARENHLRRANSDGNTPRGALTPRSGTGGSNNQLNKSVVYLNVHSGISTGIMAGIDVGDFDRWEYFLVGDPITEALHAEKLAEPGTLICGPSIHQLYHGGSSSGGGSNGKPLSPGLMSRENSNRTPFASPAPTPKGRKSSLMSSLFDSVVEDNNNDIAAALGLAIPSETTVNAFEPSSSPPKMSSLPPLSGLKSYACNFQFIVQYRSDESLGSNNSEESREGYYKLLARKSVSSTRSAAVSSMDQNGRPILRRSKSTESPSLAQLDQLVNLSSKYIANTLSLNSSPGNSVHVSRNSSVTLATSGRGNSSSFDDNQSNSNGSSQSNIIGGVVNLENLPPASANEVQSDLNLGTDGKLFQALDNEWFCTKSLPDTVRSIPENIKLQIIGALEKHVHEVVRSSLVLTSHMLEYYHQDVSDGQSTSSLMLTARDSDDDSDYYSTDEEDDRRGGNERRKAGGRRSSGVGSRKISGSDLLERKDSRAFPTMDSILTAELRQVVVLFIKIDLEVHLRFTDTDDLDFSKPAFVASMTDEDKENYVLPNMSELHFIPRTEEEYTSDAKLLATLQKCFSIIVRAFRLKGGQIRQFIVDDKGTVCIGSFGLRGSTTENDSATAAEVANIILKELQKENLNASIGITTGKAYCGLVGSPERHEYAIMSPSTNLSARMCCAASKKVGTILCDSETKDRDRYHYFKSADSIKAKGYSEAVPTFIPLFHDDHGGMHPRLGESFDYLADTYSVGSSNSPSRRSSRNSYFFNKPIAVNSLAGKLKTMSDLDYNLDLISSTYETSTAAAVDHDLSNIHGRRKDVDVILRFVYPGYQSSSTVVNESKAVLDRPMRLVIVEGTSGVGLSSMLDYTSETIFANLQTKLKPFTHDMETSIFFTQSNSVDTNTPFLTWKSIFIQFLINVYKLFRRSEIEANASKYKDSADNLVISMSLDHVFKFLAPEHYSLRPLLNGYLLPKFGSENYITSQLLGVPRAKKLMELLAEIMQKCIKLLKQNIIIVIDDLQSMDTQSWWLLRHLWQKGTGFVVISSFRTENAYRTTHSGSVNAHASQLDVEMEETFRDTQRVKRIALKPLDKIDMSFYVCQSLKLDPFDPCNDEISDRVYDLSGGNPLYASELVKTLLLKAAEEPPLGGIALQEEAIASALSSPTVTSIRRRSANAGQFEIPGGAYKEISGGTSLRSSICLGEGSSLVSPDNKSLKFCELVRSLKPNHRIEEVIYFKFDRLSSELQLITKIACVAGMNGCPFTAKMIECMLPLAQRPRDSDLESHSGSTRDLLGSASGSKPLRRRTKSGNLRPENGLDSSNISIGSLLLEAELDIPIVPEPQETQRRRASYSGGDERSHQKLSAGRAPLGVSVNGASRRPSFTLTKPTVDLKGGNSGNSSSRTATDGSMLSAREQKVRRPSFNTDVPSKSLPVTPNKDQVLVRNNSSSNLSPMQNSGTNTFTKRKSLSRPSSAKSLKAVDSDISMNNISMSNLNINAELNVQALLDTLLEQGVFLMDARLGSGMRAVRKTLLEKKLQSEQDNEGRLLTPGREGLSDELFDSIGGLSAVNAEGGEKQMQFRSSLVQVTIYGMMLETQKVYFHERLANYLEKAANAAMSPSNAHSSSNNNLNAYRTARSDDGCTVETQTTEATASSSGTTATANAGGDEAKKSSSSPTEVSASDWNIQGLHWERALVWRKAMNCYYRAGKILEDQGAFADSKSQLISAYWMFCEMRRSAGLNFHTKSDVSTEYNPFNVSTNVSPVPPEGGSSNTNGQLQSDLVALSQEDVSKIFNGNAADFEVAIHLLVKLAQCLLTMNERADVIASLYYEALQLVLTTRVGDAGTSLEEQLVSVDGIAASDPFSSGPADPAIAALMADKRSKDSALLSRLKIDSPLVRGESFVGEPSPQFPPTPTSEVTPIIGVRRHRRGSGSLGSFSPDMPGAAFIESLSPSGQPAPNSIESSGPNTPRRSGVKKRFSLSLFLPKDSEDSGSSNDCIGNLLLASTFKLNNYDCIFPILSGLIVLYGLGFIQDSATTFAKKRSIVKLFLSLSNGLVDKNGDPSVHYIRALTCKVWLHFNSGMYHRALYYMDKVMELYDFSKHHADLNSFYGCDRVMEALTFAAKSALYSGNIILAGKYTDQVIALLSRCTHLNTVALTVLPIVDVLLLVGRVNESREVFAMYKKAEVEWSGYSLLQPCNAYYEELVEYNVRINREDAVSLFMSYQEMVYRTPLVRVSVLELFLSQQHQAFGGVSIDGKIEGETTLRVLRKHARGVECTKAELCYRLAQQVCANNTNNRQNEIDLMVLFCQDGLHVIDQIISSQPFYSQEFPFDYLRCVWLTAKLTMLSVHYEQNQSVVRAAYQRSIQVLREAEIVCITVKSPFMRLMNGRVMYDVCMKGSRCNIDPATNTLFTSYEHDIICSENVIQSTFQEVLDAVAGGESGVSDPGSEVRERVVQQCCHASPELQQILNLLLTFVQRK